MGKHRKKYCTSSEDDDDEEDERQRKRRRSSKKYTTTSSSSEDGEEDERQRKRRHSSRKDERSDKRRRRKEKERKRRHKTRGDRVRTKKRSYSDSDSESEESSPDNTPSNSSRTSPEEVLRCILKEFPAVASDLEQLLRTIDSGQAVDIKGLTEKSLVRHLRKLFISLKLKERGDNCFLLPSKAPPTLELLGGMIRSNMQPKEELTESGNRLPSASPSLKNGEVTNDTCMGNSNENVADIRRRVIGPEMPSAELLAAAAKLTEAQAELREAELEEDNEVFIGPPPPDLVVEAESSNEAERFEEITRIMSAEADSPYDVMGVNRNMSEGNMKKRYWKLSLMVHPDKCLHPQAHQAFIKLNKAYKELQDPDKKKALDEQIKAREEKEEFKRELKAMKEAAQWRRLQGISMEGDDILLAETDTPVAPRRDEWMTKLPPERKPGVTMQTTKFSRTNKEGRGDTSAWTDTPSERAQKAKTSYLEAYNEATALASNEQERKQMSSEAKLVEQYNKTKRSKSLVEKHKESSAQKRPKKGSKQESTKEEWEGKHPWKPWDREKDLTAGRLNVKLDAEDMAQGLSSRFSSGSFQKSFL